MSKLPPGNKDTKAVTALGVFVQIAGFVSNKQQRSCFPFATSELSVQNSFLQVSMHVQVIRKAVNDVTSVQGLKVTQMSFSFK